MPTPREHGRSVPRENARYVLREYGQHVLPGIRLTDADRRLLEDRALDGRLRVRELTGDRLEVTAGPYVGVVRLDACELRVLPKYLGGDLDVLRMLDYAWGGTGAALPLGQDFTGGTPHLRDLVALMVTEHAERLLRHGVRGDYLTREDDLPVVRGRLLPDRQLIRHHGRLDRLACRFDEHDADIVDNRLCAHAVERAARTARSPEVRSRARRAAARFAGYAPGPLGDLRSAVSQLVYHRQNEHYRPAHLWARLLLSGGGIQDLFTAGPLASRAFLVDMNQLFEAFVTRLLREGAAAAGVRADAQSRQRRVLFDEVTGAPYSEVRPDVLISGTRDGAPFRLPVDVKYKLYDRRKLSTQDLYQAFLYAHALSGSPGRCSLVHPGDAGASGATVSVRGADGGVSAVVRAVPVDLRAVLGELAGPEPVKAPARLFGEVLG
ncbi:McrC family protein [Streptomyces sp. NPDC017254]|uniref:McrC family protein n=1 Tax=unclassified Streptomyces TaxID=2593676 RepID=UPI00378A6E15